MNPKIAHVMVGLPLEGPFDYLIPEHIDGKVAVGCRVLLVFARKKCVGVVTGLAETSSFKELNAIIKVLDDAPVFSASFIAFAKDFGLRFGCSTGEALLMALPAYLRLAHLHKRKDAATTDASRAERKALSCKAELLFAHGLSRRWEVVLERVRGEIEKGRRALVLVPDAAALEAAMNALAPVAKGGVGVVLRQGTPKEEYEKWARAVSGTSFLALGFISGVMLPMENLGLIVVIDEESPFYKNEQTPFYQAGEAALLRSREEKCDVLFVSGAPSLERWADAGAGRLELTVLPDDLAPIKLLDLSNYKMKKDTFLSSVLCQDIEKVLADGEKVFFYIQAARGVAGVIAEAKKRFPSAVVAGYDKVSGAFPEHAHIIVGTQVIFRKRMSFSPAISVVLDIDWELHKNDHRAAQTAFTLVRYLKQMSTKAVVLQTRKPALSALLLQGGNDPEKFYASEMQTRQEAKLPPYGALVAVVVRSEDPALAASEAARLYDTMLKVFGDTLNVWEPQADRAAVVRGKFRHLVMVQGEGVEFVSTRVSGILRAFRAKKDAVITMNVDP